MPQPYFEETIHDATDCMTQCEVCVVECLQSPDVERLRECILLCLDCADVCRALLALLGRTSEHSREMISFAREIVTQCGAECRKHKEMQHCIACAEACGRFATLAERQEKSFIPGFLQ